MATRTNCDRLWRIWYTIMVLLLHLFLLYAAFQRYTQFRATALRESWDMSSMNFYLVMMVFACFLLPLFLYAAFVKTGNYAEEGIQLGHDPENLKIALTETGQATPGSCVGRLKRHFLPLTCIIHLLISYCLLIPMPVLEAQEIKHEKLNKMETWRTNLDFAFRPTTSARQSISTEIFNMVLALAIFIIRYPSVFWFTNKIFSFLFSVIICIGSIHAILGYEATSVLFKASLTSDVAVNLNPVAIISLHTIGDLLLMIAHLAFFEFGYAQMLNNLRKYRHYLQLEAASGSSDRSTSSTVDDSPCWLNYAPHLIGILLMVLSVVCKAPVLWDWVGVYRASKEPIMLAAIISGGIYLVLWIATWFLFGLKSNWRFHIHLPPMPEIPNKLGLNNSHPCTFHDNPSLMHTPDHRHGPGSTDSSDNKSNPKFVIMSNGISTISEQVDQDSESSYNMDGERQSGLVKYQVRRNSASSLNGNNSMKRNTFNRKSGNRVTFKDSHDMCTIPGSPGSSQNTSSDSGIESNRTHNHIQYNVNDDYAQVTRPRAPSRQSNTNDDYAMFGNLFQQQQETDYYTRHEIDMGPTYMSHTDIYGRIGSTGGVPVLPPPPIMQNENICMDYPEAEYLRVPDLLLSKSPYSSLSRSQKSGHSISNYNDFMEMHQGLPPPPPELEDRLCSQV